MEKRVAIYCKEECRGPEPVETYNSEEFKEKLVIGFLIISILTNEIIQLRLNKGR